MFCLVLPIYVSTKVTGKQRYTQAMHTQTLTQQSLTHVRSELTALRAMTNRQSVALASGAGAEDRLAEVERRYEEARESGLVEARRARDEGRKRKRADARIGESGQQEYGHRG